MCPLVEESEESEEETGDLAAAEERYRVFKAVFGERVALAHGKQKPAERQAAMQGFAGAEFDVLVATTVVEVGVDVPEATIIVIEHAERFGLAQLHQLRGRVGRGSKASSCILLYSPRCSETAKKRLKIIRDCDDGFTIAEEDMMLRGAGDALGTRQSGMPNFRFADLALHRELVLAARDDVKLILHRDAELASERGQALRILLYLFDYDSSLKLLRAG
jgi:ATP-dependent DNA helicase RecG